MLVHAHGQKFSCLFAMLLMHASALAAEPERAARFHFSLIRGTPSSVLDLFSRQTELQVFTKFDITERDSGELGPFFGDATADEALTDLLASTDMSYTWQDAGTILINKKLVEPPHADGNVQEVLVTGTRFYEYRDGPAPVRVFGREKIKRYGVSSASDLSRYMTQQPFSFNGGALQSNAQFFQMRGLGFDTTLVLINGRRMPPSATSITLNAVDTNSIPLMAVDRIEVMSDAASAIYGADAIGGVVNVILKDRIEEPRIDLHYGEANGGGRQWRVAGSMGGRIGRLTSTLVVEGYETDALMGDTRKLWRNQDYRRFGGRDYRITAANPGNVYSLTEQFLPGLSSSVAAVPSETTGSLTPADFLATSGQSNLQSSFRRRSITSPSRRSSAYGSAQYSFAESYDLFAEVLAANSEVTTLLGSPAINRQIVPASNPFNPFGVPVAVDYAFDGMSPVSQNYSTELARVVGGIRGVLRRWNWEISGLRHGEYGLATERGRLDVAHLGAALGAESPLTALNLFSAGPAGAPELLRSLTATPQTRSFSFSSLQLSAFIRGPMFEMGERMVELVVGAEWRHEAAGFYEPAQPVQVARDVASIFYEIQMPLPDELSLKLAARSDEYDGGEQILNPQYGITWRPAGSWLFRAAYGTSFRPPSLYELDGPTRQSTLPISDPLRDGAVSSVDFILGGNRELDIVTGRSFTAGFVYKPLNMRNLRLLGSYWRVRMTSRILAPTLQELLKPEGEWSTRVVRDAPSYEDVQADQPGRLRSINLRRVNYGDLETSGIDLDASLLVDHPWGCLQLELAMTWVDDYISRDMNQLLPLDRVGIANAEGTIPRWRATGTVTWKLNGFGISTTTTFVSSNQDTDPVTGPLDRRIDAQLLVDLQAWVDLGSEGSSLLDSSTLTLGARNLFDEAPEFANAAGSFGYDFSQSDLTSRLLYFRVSKRF